jgi:hypothetical protein
MPLRTPTGQLVAASAWMMPDESIVFVKLSQKEFDVARASDALGRYRPPDPAAQHVMSIGGIPALDTVDGFPEPGDYWEQDDVDDDGKTIKTLHYQTGTDLFGYWGVQLLRETKTAQGASKLDPFTGKPLMERYLKIDGNHCDVLTNYDLKTIDQYVPVPPSRAVSTALVDVAVDVTRVV